MSDAILARYKTWDQGTFSEFVLPGFFLSVVMIELPWRGNAVDVSCIPCGEYRCTREFFEDFKRPHWGYRVHGVPGRTGIRIHRANHAGDVLKGWKSDVKGCMGPGLRAGELLAAFKDGRPAKMQEAALSSEPALNRMLAKCGDEFMLRIESRCAESFVA